MKALRRIPIVLSGGVFLLLVGVLFGTKEGRAVVATQVFMANPILAPGKVQEVGPGNHPFQRAILLSQYAPFPQLEFPVPTTLADGSTVQRAVIEQISGACTYRIADVTVNYMSIATTLGGADAGTIIPIPPANAVTDATNQYATVSYFQTTRTYADPGATVIARPLPVRGVFGVDYLDCSVDYSGYYVTQ